ncbi:MAG: PDDEXK nuclease domain-containing protein [Bacteroidales bacterium]|nr:PDDEXK nuclease domain-containing protein [Bacteroidales bacterium]
MNQAVNINQAVNEIKTAILKGQYEAAKNVNKVQLMLYFAIGKYISINTRENAWGNNVLDSISTQLRKELPGLRGFSSTQLRDMRRFYEEWKILDHNSAVTNSAVTTAELQNIDNKIDIDKSIYIPNVNEFPIEDFFNVPFTHHTQIIFGTKDTEARYYYIHRTAEEHLSVEKLKGLIKDNTYQNNKIPNNFSSTIKNSIDARKAVMMFKDEYLLNFINVEEIGERDQIDVDERVIEQKIVANVKNFIMTFGNDFTFVGNQYRLEVYGVEQFPDLLFFNRELNSLVVVELKMGEFKTSYLGQLFGYLQILDDHIRKPHENPSIGIVLCKSANKSYAEYAVRDYSKPMGVATYKTLDEMPQNLQKTLPDIQKLIELI